MHKHLKQQLIPPDHINTKLSAGIAEVIEMMMAKNRDDRYKSAKDVLVDLECIAKGEAPLLARERFDAKLLTDLAEESSVSGQQIAIEGPIPTGDVVKPKPKPAPVLKPVAPPTPTSSILILALVVSVIINLLLALYAILW